MDTNTINIGYCPTKRELFDPEAPSLYRDRILETCKLFHLENIRFYDIAEVVDDGLLYRREDAPKVVRYFREKSIDALFFPHCNFGTEFLVAEVAAAFDRPVLLWGPRDEAPSPETGLRERDSQCGLFATGKVLRRFNVKFTYLINNRVESSAFKDGFSRFIKVAGVVKSLRGLKILQISTRPTPFMSVIFNESELIEKFGIVTEAVTIHDIVKRTEQFKKANGRDFTELVESVGIVANGIPEDAIKTIAALKISIKELADEHGCRAAAIQCWDALHEELGVVPCFANALLTDEGFPCACETDVNGAISAVLLQAATGGSSATFFADMTVRHPDDDNAELLWHCGPFPYSLAKNKDIAFVGESWSIPGVFGACDWELKGGDLTLARFEGDHGEYKLFIGEAIGTDGPRTRGTYLWAKMKNWPKWERKLVEGPYIHHMACIHAKCAEILYEACKYVPGLAPDPVEPDLDEIIRRWD
jgi:L-fucose isomerase-like protein